MSLGPTWKNNLVVFLLLTLLVVSYFFYQQQSLRMSYQQHSREHSAILAAVVQLNVHNAYLTSDTIETVIKNSLANSVRFISYLNDVEPFAPTELAAYAREAGLAGISILDMSSGETVSGPSGWLGEPEGGCSVEEELRFLADQHLYLYTFPASSCVFVGLDAGNIVQMQNEVSVERLLDLLNNLAGIAYVRVEKREESNDVSAGHFEFATTSSGATVVETTLQSGGMTIVVGLHADRLVERMGQLRTQFVGFLFVLLTIGILSSWWLYRVQKQRLADARGFERQLARQHEAAALGRTTATITHEMRNPLNAIGIGLQRLEIEASDLSDEHKGLVAGMREAVNRSNGIITRLRQYVHSFELDCQAICLYEFLATLINLYSTQCKTQGITVHLHGDKSATVLGDRNLLGQVFENLLKNGLEAQPEGGTVDIKIGAHGNGWVLVWSNGGALPDAKDTSLLLEPFFTTKAKGTGLGLAVSTKIVNAHGGKLAIQVNRDKELFEVKVYLPGEKELKNCERLKDQ